MRVNDRIQKMCELAVSKWGYGPQLVILIEECAELVKEACKVLRGNERQDKFIEELADVCVMCKQMQLILQVSDEELEARMEAKMIRTMERGGIKV